MIHGRLKSVSLIVLSFQIAIRHSRAGIQGGLRFAKDFFDPRLESAIVEFASA